MPLPSVFFAWMHKNITKFILCPNFPVHSRCRCLSVCHHYFPCSPAHPGSWRISRWIMGCRVSAQVALISFLWSALLREENCCVLQVEIWIIVLLKILVMYYASWFCHDFRHSFCHVFLLVILVWSLWFEFVSFGSVFCDWNNCLNFCLFSPPSINSFSNTLVCFASCLLFFLQLSHLENVDNCSVCLG